MQKPIDRKLFNKGTLRKVIPTAKIALGQALKARLASSAPVVDARGELHEAATLIKALHSSGPTQRHGR